jgi:membrane protease YdiL (CAAX protease family)
MVVTPAARVREVVRRHPLASFFVLAYALAWADWLPMALAGQRVATSAGEPTHFLGLLGPLIAAFTITLIVSGLPGVRELAARTIRIPYASAAVWFAIASPALLFVAALLIGAIAGKSPPRLSELGMFGGVPHVGAPGVWLILVVWNGFGEEVGWRGFALPQLQRTRSPLVAATLLGIGWAGWHLPMFFVLDTYRALGPAILPGFVLGIVSGSIVLAWLYNRSGGSILAVALWHGSYNFFSGTLAARGLVAAVVSTAVVIWAAVLVLLELRACRHHQPSIIGARPGLST